MSADAPASNVLPGRGRGAPIRPVGQRMGATTDPDVVALAACVQELARRAFPTRTWSQLVARLSSEEREALGGGDDRRLSRLLSAQFGAKARRGPNRPTILAVLCHCLPAVEQDAREPKQVEVLALFRAVHGPNSALTASPLARPRAGRLGAQLHHQRGENDLLIAQNLRLQQDKVVLECEIKAFKARIQALEGQLAAVSAPAPRSVGIASDTDSLLVRPYIPEQRPAERPLGDDPDDPPSTWAFDTQPGSPAGDDGGAAATPSGSTPSSAWRATNTPRGFRPLQALSQYPPDLAPPAVSTPAPPWVPRPRVVGRAPAPEGARVPPPRVLTPGSVWGAVTASPVPLALPALLPPRIVGGSDADTRAARRLARAELARLIAGLQSAWSDAWADLPLDRLPPGRRGLAQMPLLLVAYVLATLIASAPFLLD